MAENPKNFDQEDEMSPEMMEELRRAISGVTPIFVPIPSLFCDSITKEPYQKCLICGDSLENKSYRINKVFKKYPDFDLTETLVEMAICDTCAFDAAFKISKASEKVMMEFFSPIDFIGRAVELHQSEQKNNYEAWIDRCIVTNKKCSELAEYQIIGSVSKDNQLILNEELFMVSGEAIEALTEKLSPETKQDMEDFTGKYFGIPPELLPEDQPKLILV